MECNELTSMLVQDEPIVKSQRANSVHFLSHQKAEKNYIYKKVEGARRKVYTTCTNLLKLFQKRNT